MSSPISSSNLRDRQPIERPRPQRPYPVPAENNTTTSPSSRPSPFGSDTVSLRSEATETAAVDPAVCGNNWRCLEQLQERGLLS